ncbi:FHA domain-containing protein [Undibacterium umbellatum]|uniref:FHA domain-containing protein n=1 Tax=Undibacterium umbellatum TaxID=2762300 RepID=A0ABR6ZIB4_9BURK|nr:FHA domain-containing protein [Undibacterium umbellatum]MBC3911445.1 FHA domain-containing protein [Undibacterium umbellatum]
MKKCLAPDHPHCTHWVAEGETVCTAGHQQRPIPQRLELLHASADSLVQNHEAVAPVNLHLHFSGYDPRAAGGRQTIRLELRGTLPPDVTSIEVQLRSDLIAITESKQRFQRTASGQWPALLISFSSKNKEHGQYPVEVVLLHEQANRPRRKWLCTSVIFVPRADASLTEIHSVFLATQKNVRVVAEDGAIATFSGQGQSNGYAQGNINIEINAKDAAIAKMEMRAATGKYEIAMGTIAWDEELIEVSPEAMSIAAPATPPPEPVRPAVKLPAISTKTAAPTKTASLIAGQERIRLFAMEEWVLGRMEEQPQADILLSHRDHSADENARLTRRISARHAIIRRKGAGAEITDVSRYGTLLDGICMEKDQAYNLRAGMQIEFCASVRGIVKLQVVAILPHAAILGDAATGPGSSLLYLIKPQTRTLPTIQNLPEGLPVILHFQDGFWHRDKFTLQDTRLDSLADLRALTQLPAGCRYLNSAYPDNNQ